MSCDERENIYIPFFVRRLMPGASETDLRQAAENLRAYLAVIYTIYERRRSELGMPDSPESIADDRLPTIGS